MSGEMPSALFDPRRRMPPLFVTAAASAVVASLLGSYLLPGMRGNASGHAVELLERVSGTISYAAWALLLLYLVLGATTLAQRARPTWFIRGALLLGAVCVSFAAVHASFTRLEEVLSILLSLAAEAAVLLGAGLALRNATTRAAGIVLIALAFSSAAHLASWELATAATERIEPRLYNFARVAATISALLELFAQALALAWLARQRWPLGKMNIGATKASQSGAPRASLPGAWVAVVAIVVALVVIFAAARGADGSAGLVDVVLHASLDRATTPPAFGLGSASFLAPIALATAVAMFVTVPSAGPIGVCLVLGLVARGAYDVPLRALAATCAAYYLAIAAGSASASAFRARRESVSTANAKTDK